MADETSHSETVWMEEVNSVHQLIFKIQVRQLTSQLLYGCLSSSCRTPYCHSKQQLIPGYRRPAVDTARNIAYKLANDRLERGKHVCFHEPVLPWYHMNLSQDLLSLDSVVGKDDDLEIVSSTCEINGITPLVTRRCTSKSDENIKISRRLAMIHSALMDFWSSNLALLDRTRYDKSSILQTFIFSHPVIMFEWAEFTQKDLLYLSGNTDIAPAPTLPSDHNLGVYQLKLYKLSHELRCHVPTIHLKETAQDAFCTLIEFTWNSTLHLFWDANSAWTELLLFSDYYIPFTKSFHKKASSNRLYMLSGISQFFENHVGREVVEALAQVISREDSIKLPYVFPSLSCKVWSLWLRFLFFRMWKRDHYFTKSHIIWKILTCLCKLPKDPDEKHSDASLYWPLLAQEVSHRSIIQFHNHMETTLAQNVNSNLNLTPRCHLLQFIELFNDDVIRKVFYTGIMRDAHQKQVEDEVLSFTFATINKWIKHEIESDMVLSSLFNDAFRSLQSPNFKIYVDRSDIPDEVIKSIIWRREDQLKKPIKTMFINEPGIDQGGLTVEVFSLFSRKYLQKSLGLFQPLENGYYWFAPRAELLTELEGTTYYRLGALHALSIYNSVPAVFPLPTIFYNYLYNPEEYVHFDMLKEGWPTLYKNLNTDIDFEDMDWSYTFSDSQNSNIYVAPLWNGQRSDCVNISKKMSLLRSLEFPIPDEPSLEFYRKLYTDWVTYLSVEEPLKCFAAGFNSIFGPNPSQNPLLAYLTPARLSHIVSGVSLTVETLKKGTYVDERLPRTDPQIEWFWQVLREFESDGTFKDFCRFAFASDRVLSLPENGESPSHHSWLAEQDFLLRVHLAPVYGLFDDGDADIDTENDWRHKRQDDQRLFVARTCSGVLEMPVYSSKAVLKRQLKECLKWAGSGFHTV